MPRQKIQFQKVEIQAAALIAAATILATRDAEPTDAQVIEKAADLLDEIQNQNLKLADNPENDEEE